MRIVHRVIAIAASLALAACGDNHTATQCGSDSDCTGSATACESFACVSGACKAMPVAAGIAPTQVQGSCKTTVCDGSGIATVVVDDANAPTSNGCVVGSCAGGEPSTTAKSAGATCGSGLVCDDQGQCVGCLAAIGCPGTDTECQARTCSNNTCGVAFVAAGTACGVSDDSCDGSGNCTHLCGNGAIDNDEQCDGNDLGGATCASEGFAQGTLSCTSSCTLNKSDCSTCGDGAIEGPEVCDGSALGTNTCQSLGHPPGTLVCGADCLSFDVGDCTGGYIAANTSFTGTVSTNGLHYDGLNEELAVSTIDQGVWRGTVDNPGPIDDPIWANADGSGAGTSVTSLFGRGIATLNINGKIAFFTIDTAGTNFWNANSGGFNSGTWQTGANQVAFPQRIFAVMAGNSNNNYLGGWDPTSGQATVLHGNTLATVCTANGQLGCAFPVLLGARVTGTVTSIASGQDNPTSSTLDVHVAVTGTNPAGAPANGGGIYWSCDNGNSYVEDDGGVAVSDKPAVFTLTADRQTFVTQMTARTCPTTGNAVTAYASVMYAGLLGGGSLYKTTNGGATWSLSNTGLPGGVSVFAIAIDCAATTNGAQTPVCANDQLLYAATSAGIYKSIDAGTHWALDGLPGSVTRSVVVEPTHPNAAIAASPGGATETGNTATFTVNAHDFHVGDPLVVFGVAESGYNGNFTVATVISPTQFTVTLPTAGLAASGGGTAFLVTPRVFAATDQLGGIFQTNVPVVP